VRDRRVGVGAWPCLVRLAPARHAAAAPPRARRAARPDRHARPGRPRPRTAQHHRPRDRRPADRQRGREPADRRQRRVLRFRVDPHGARVARPRFPDAIGQRDRAPPLRGLEPAVPPPAPRRVRLRDLGRARRAPLRRARPLRDQAALLRPEGRRLPRRVGDQGAARARRGAGLGPRGGVRHAPRGGASPSGADRLRRRPPGAAGPLPDHRRRDRARAPVLGLGLPHRRPHRLRPQPARMGGRAAGAPGRGGAAAPARRRPGRVLPQRRPRLVRRARPRLPAVEPPAAGLHAVLRPGGLRRARSRRSRRSSPGRSSSRSTSRPSTSPTTSRTPSTTPSGRS